MAKKWSIVGTDNWARDYNGGKSEFLIGEADTEQEAKIIADEWNKKNNPDGLSHDYAVVRKPGYTLYKFEGY